MALRLRALPIALAILAGPVSLTGCQRAYYRALESVGVQKRELLVNRVEDARESQEEAKEQFRNALEAFSAVTQFEGGELEAIYERLESEYEQSKSRAEEVRERIDEVDEVAGALFREWEDELDDYESAKLRRQSEAKLREARRRYDTMLAAMRNAESKMDPVLTALNDRVLYLKHNLNAQAVASLEGNVQELETDVEALIRDMETAIEEAEAFISEMRA